MTIEVKEAKLQNLEDSSQLIERIRQQLVHMNSGVIADFETLSNAVTALFEDHNRNKELALISRNTKFDQFREQRGLTAYLSIQELTSVEFPDTKDQSMNKPFGFVRTLKINNHTMFLECNLNWGEIWTYSSHMIDNIFPGKLACIADIQKITDQHDYQVFVNIF